MASRYLQTFPIPQGFPELLHDFSREVLRDQPDNIHEYAFLYFKAMEQVRYDHPIIARASRLSMKESKKS